MSDFVGGWSLVGKPALFLIHMQNSICKTPSPLEPFGHARATWEDGIVPRIQDLLRAFRAKSLPVIYVVTYSPEEFKVPAYGPFWSTVRDSKVNLLGTRDIEVIEELAPEPGEPIFLNWPFNIFQVNDLEEYLAEQGIETIVLTGVATGMSLGHATFCLADRFYNLIVPSDTCTDGNRELHDAVINGMIPAVALVTTAEDVIAHL
jgi:nicotinamidase-related amidase